jgi:ribosome recycling factor
MTRFSKPNSHVSLSTSTRRPEPLSDQRYQDLLKSAKAFFESTDVSAEQARRDAISEILELMARYGLSVDDLV